MTQTTKEDLLRLVAEHQQEIKQFGVKRCGLFGSYVREQHKLESDVDVLVEFEPGKKLLIILCAWLSFLRNCSAPELI